MSLMNTYTLENGVKIPVLGFGTWQTPAGKVATDAVLAALDAGWVDKIFDVENIQLKR